MIAALALALALQPQTGTTFVCGGVSLATASDIGVPAGEEDRSFLVAGPGGEARVESILDLLPDALVVTWRREHNSPVVLEIGNIDLGARSAEFTLRSELNPASRLFTPLETSGTCTLQPGAPVQQDPPS